MPRKRPRRSNKKSSFNRRQFLKLALITAGSGAALLYGYDHAANRYSIYHENKNPTKTYDPGVYGIVTYRTPNPNPDNETIIITKDLHPEFTRPYTWKIQSEVYNIFFNTLLLNLGLQTNFAESLIGEYHVVTKIHPETDKLVPYYPTDWNREYFDHVINQVSTRDKAILMEHWNNAMTQEYYPFQKINLPLYTPLSELESTESPWHKEIPPAYASLEFVIQDDLFTKGIENRDLFYPAVEIANKMKQYELNGDIGNPEYQDLSIILDDYTKQRNHYGAYIIKYVVEDNKRTKFWEIPTRSLVIGGSHVDDSYGENDLKILLEQRDLDVVVIEPPSFQEVFERYLRDSGYPTTSLPEDGFKTRLGWYKPNQKILVA